MFENNTADKTVIEAVKKVGRPKKVAVVASETEPTPKKRGRPPKITLSEPEPTTPKKRGRPRKITLDELELGTPPKKSVSVKTPKTLGLEPKPKKVKELTEEQIQKLKLKEEKILLKEQL